MEIGTDIDVLPAGAALAREQEMLAEVSADPGKRFVWLWQSPQGLVAPRNLAVKPGFDAVCAEMAEAGWPVDIRATGGDATPQGPGIVNITHVYARSPGGPVNIEAEYNRLCAPIVAALGAGASVGWQPGAFCDGAYNVQYQGLKFAGTAMRFRPCRVDKTRYAVLAHALMLFTPPTPEAIAAINTFLERLGEPRVIAHGAHTGLPAQVSPEDFAQELARAMGEIEV
ncbi:lipoate--protein ligase family protein [Roseobacteraceae bacterium S113]